MPTTRKRPRNAEATRKAIEAAACRHFMARPYDQVGLREIAQEAGVDAALINRYYGSKKGLFETAILPHFSIDILVQGDMSDFGRRVAGLILDPGHKQDFDPNRALLHSISSPEVGPMVAQALNDNAVADLSARIGGAEAGLRAALALAVLTGVDALYRVARLDTLTRADPEALKERLGALLQGLVDAGDPG
ncbi:TetR/AcrR family transcriptional regulator [Pseudooceanicola sp. CBS1P-1]|uniref:TetR family transcriptional regulator n=1 Tax=Pseudooceanicola albus TaxID=2692189 RepID=A0A6L7G0F8_9RHOB|nr:MULTISPECIES: TetR/AcrR family transcriptional regulator [Pseudooceanicola]MBT9382315.1 TetR/AcrR family transcriptional regulator [Pseudooceanicola endophyticus]MXN16857.1 TetR family transcriptional regulator [Pseudooceanicola albus]